MSDTLDRAAAATALLPVRAALLARAHADAEGVVHAAAEDADRAVTHARDEAATAVETARAEGEADAVTAFALDRGRARRHARSLVLAARRAAYDDLLAAARDGVLGLLGDEQWPRMRDMLEARVREVLGPEASVEVLPDGVTGRSGTRVLELRLTSLAEAQVEALGAAVEELWS